MALGLSTMFPRKGLEDQLARTNRTDPLTVEYLKAFIAAKPDVPRLRLMLARAQIQLGRYDEARATLRPFARSPMDEDRVEAEFHEYELREREAFALAPGSARREEAIRDAQEQLRRLAALSLTAVQAEYLARRAVAIGETQAAIALYARLAAPEIARAPQASAEAAALVLGMGGYEVAAQLYFRAQERSYAVPRRREYFAAGVNTLMAGNLYDVAIAQADRHVGALADDPDTLKFLVRIAQAANRPDAAQRYAKRLLKMAMLERLREIMLRQGVALVRADAGELANAHAQAAPWRAVRVSGEGRGPGLPFDDEAYSLGFATFLAAGNLADAYRVAASAVAQAPQAAEWRKRFAQVAEWRGAPQVALPQWLAHARMSGEEASWDAVLRLARALQDDPVLLIALGHRLERDPRNAGLIEDMIGAHERLGDPDAAIALLQARARGPERRRLLERLAALAERAGRDRLAQDTLVALQREFGPSLGYARRIAERHYLTGDLRAALAALEEVEAQAPPAETSYWQMVAELARLLQMDEKALAGYRRLLVSEKYREDDLVNMIALFDAMRPQHAARVAEFAYARFGRADLALQVMYQYSRAGEAAGVARFLAGLSDRARGELERDTRFLTARAAHHQAVGNLRAALADWTAANALAPADAETQAAMLWAMIALRDARGLEAALRRFAAAAEREPLLWGPFAAAHMATNRQALALRWFRRQAGQKNDYLWLMAYAECLEANAQPEVAWRIRRHVWTELRRPGVLAAIPADQLMSMRDRLAATSQTFAAGDRAKAIIEALLRADLEELRRPAAPAPLPANGAELAAALDAAASMPETRQAPGPLPQGWFARAGEARELRHPAADNDPTVKELALAWALNNDAQELARAWLVTRFADNLARPLWGQLSVALAGTDRDTLTRLLDDLPDWLPMYDRVEAALRVGRPGLAQTLAFEQLDHLQHDEELHLRFTSMATQDPARLAGGIGGVRQSPLSITETRVEASADLTPRLKLGFTLSVNRQSSQDETQLINVPQTDLTAALFARVRTESGAATLTLAQRQAVREVTSLKLDYELGVAPRLRLAGSAGVNVVATELAILRVGAMKANFDNSLTWTLSSREYLRASLSLNRYASQSGAELGRSAIYGLEAGHRIRLEYPDFNLRAFVTRANLAARASDDALMASLRPAALNAAQNTYLTGSYTQWGVAAGFGQFLQQRYTRALRPFLDVSLFHNSATGVGRGIRLGLAGSLAGQDHAALYFSQSTGTPGAPQGFREFGLTYQWFY